jgi:hypothetical protein
MLSSGTAEYFLANYEYMSKEDHKRGGNYRDNHGNNPGQDNFNRFGNRENTGQNGNDSEDRPSEKEKKPRHS